MTRPAYLDQLPERQRQVCEWVIAHGIDPGNVPDWADFACHPGKPNRWRVQVLDLDADGNPQRFGERLATTFVEFDELQPFPRGTRVGVIAAAVYDLDYARGELGKVDHEITRSVARTLGTVTAELRRLL